MTVDGSSSSVDGLPSLRWFNNKYISVPQSSEHWQLTVFSLQFSVQWWDGEKIEPTKQVSWSFHHPFFHWKLKQYLSIWSDPKQHHRIACIKTSPPKYCAWSLPTARGSGLVQVNGLQITGTLSMATQNHSQLTLLRDSKQNLRFATVLGDRHHVFTQRVAWEQAKFAFRHSSGRSTARF